VNTETHITPPPIWIIVLTSYW